MRVPLQALLVFLVVGFLYVGIAQDAMAHPSALHQKETSLISEPATHNPAMEKEAYQDSSQDRTVHEEELGHEPGAEEGGHSHWGLSPDSTPFAKSMAAIGKFHPLIVHFPIALFLTAALAQALLLARQKASSRETVSFLVWTGLLGVIAASLLGWAHSGPPQHAEAPVMFSHRWIGTGLLLGAIMTTFLMEQARKHPQSLAPLLFNLFLFSMAIAVAINGFLGGALAHGGIKHLMPGMG